MKKALMLGAAIVAIGALPALAEDGGKKAPRDHGKMMEKIFAEQDANGDGVVSKDEFVAHATKRFEDMDGNKDGKVTKEEIKAHHEAKRAEWKAKRDAKKAAETPAAETPATETPAQ